MCHPAFVSGNFDTHFVKNYFVPGQEKHSSEDEIKIAAIIALRSIQKNIKNEKITSNPSVNTSSWKNNRLRNSD